MFEYNIKTQKMKKLILYILVVMLPILGFSQNNLTLTDAINIALKNNIGIQIAQNSVDISVINNNFGTAGGLPFVGATASNNEQLTSLNQEYANPINNKTSNNTASNSLTAGVAGSMMLYNFGRVGAEKKRLNNVVTQNKIQLSSRALILVYNVMLKYYDIIRQQGYGKTLQQSITVSKERLVIVKAQQSVGMANNADLFQSQVDLNTQNLNLQAQQLIIEQGKTDLLLLLTLRPDSAININDTILIDKSIRLDSVMANITTNPDIKAAAEQIKINQYVVKEIQALRYPAVGVTGGYNFVRTQSAAGFTLLNQNLGPFLGLTFSIPLFNGGVYRKQEQIAKINVSSSRSQTDTLVLDYKANAVKSWQAYKSNQQQLETAQENAKLSKQLLDLVLQRFQLHQATIIDVRTAQQSFEDAGYTLINLSYAAKAGEIQLKRYANKLFY